MILLNKFSRIKKVLDVGTFLFFSSDFYRWTYLVFYHMLDNTTRFLKRYNVAQWGRRKRR
jgi:hypothetical protein